jgi:hypothetical protein
MRKRSACYVLRGYWGRTQAVHKICSVIYSGSQLGATKIMIITMIWLISVWRGSGGEGVRNESHSIKLDHAGWTGVCRERVRPRSGPVQPRPTAYGKRRLRISGRQDSFEGCRAQLGDTAECDSALARFSRVRPGQTGFACRSGRVRASPSWSNHLPGLDGSGVSPHLLRP